MNRLREALSRKWRKSRLSEEEAIARDHEMAIALEDQMLEEARTQRRQYPEVRLGVDVINQRCKLVELDQRLGSKAPTDSSHTRRNRIGSRKKALQTPHQYSQLHKNSIRLLKFRQAAGELSCSLQEASIGLRTFDTYEAVSYVWGPADLTHHVLLDDDTTHLKITARLHAILEQLRSLSKIVSDGSHGFGVWVDAICINQEDVPV